jgi:hypothetical protein
MAYAMRWSACHMQNVQVTLLVVVWQALAGQRITEEAALDWLCLHLDPKDLPRRFAGVSHLRNGAGPVRLVAKADPNAAARRCAYFYNGSTQTRDRALWTVWTHTHTHTYTHTDTHMRIDTTHRHAHRKRDPEKVLCV